MGDFFDSVKAFRGGNREINRTVREGGRTARELRKFGNEWGRFFGEEGGYEPGFNRGAGDMSRSEARRYNQERRAMEARDRRDGFSRHSSRYQRQLEREAEREEAIAQREEMAVYGDRVALSVNPSLASAAADRLREDPRIQAFLEENGRDPNRGGSWWERNAGMGTQGATDAEVLMAFERLYENDLQRASYDERTGESKYTYIKQGAFEAELRNIVNGGVPKFGTQNSRYHSQDSAPVVTYAPQAAASAPAAAAPSSWSNVTLPSGVTGGQTVTAPSAPAAATNTDQWRAFDEQNALRP